MKVRDGNKKTGVRQVGGDCAYNGSLQGQFWGLQNQSGVPSPAPISGAACGLEHTLALIHIIHHIPSSYRGWGGQSRAQRWTHQVLYAQSDSILQGERFKLHRSV